MCIIVVKPRGKEIPTKEVFETCFRKNSDGAGMMYIAKEGEERKVFIDKGYMTFDAFYKKVSALTEEGVLNREEMAVFHFRIATSGGTVAAKTHPFPLTNKLKVLDTLNLTTDIGIVHNGIIPIKRSVNVSDTQEFIRKFLSKKETIEKIFKRDKKTHKLISKEGGASRFAFLTADNITMLGSGWEQGEKGTTEEGLHFSNDGYKTYYNKNWGREWEADKDKSIIKAGDKFSCGDTSLTHKEKILEQIVLDFWKIYTQPANQFNYKKAVAQAINAHKYKLNLSYTESSRIGFNS